MRYFFALALASSALASDPAPAPKLIQQSAVNKVERPAAPPWVEITADPLLTTLQAPSAAKWVQIDEGCDVRPAADGLTAIFAAIKAGRYRLVVIPKDGDPIRVAVLVGKVDPPAPQPPEPGPQPKPPAPPEPSSLGKRFQAEYEKDARQLDKRRMDLADLIELYKQAADLAADTTVTSTGQLVGRVRDASRVLGIDGLADLRRAIAAELIAALPSDEPLTAALRTKAAETFTRIRSALQEVK
jgi:hypothetical protein